MSRRAQRKNKHRAQRSRPTLPASALATASAIAAATMAVGALLTVNANLRGRATRGRPKNPRG